MSPKFFSFKSLEEKRNQPQESKDELAHVKAAAWAWYQRGSRSQGKRTSNFHVTRTQREAMPSRYKLEAMRMANEGINESLLDNYEVQCISRQLDRLIIESRNGNNYANNSSRRTNKKRIVNGFWARNGIVCGGRSDVVDGSALSSGGRPGCR